MPLTFWHVSNHASAMTHCLEANKNFNGSLYYLELIIWRVTVWKIAFSQNVFPFLVKLWLSLGVNFFQSLPHFKKFEFFIFLLMPSSLRVLNQVYFHLSKIIVNVRPGDTCVVSSPSLLISNSSTLLFCPTRPFLSSSHSVIFLKCCRQMYSFLQFCSANLHFMDNI